MADPTTGELFKIKAVTDDEVNVAVDAYLAAPDMGPFPIAEGYRIDIDAAVKASNFATLVVSDDHASPAQKAKAVRTAILLARPVAS
ncbi:hypothetical protein ACFZ8E_07250 [Methylobacterium sp. HMF5984]|uniref:hypothetical protein n=1 Tax=Methylobacterium sp. HMF5984 TaxID=3367370 RepID=UPI003853B625